MCCPERLWGDVFVACLFGLVCACVCVAVDIFCPAAALPVPDVDSKVLAAVVQETIFSQLLRLPQSDLSVLAYAKVTVSPSWCSQYAAHQNAHMLQLQPP